VPVEDGQPPSDDALPNLGRHVVGGDGQHVEGAFAAELADHVVARRRTDNSQSVFGQFRGFIRLGCTLGGSPGIFG
jgi:hypothetical protein